MHLLGSSNELHYCTLSQISPDKFCAILFVYRTNFVHFTYFKKCNNVCIKILKNIFCTNEFFLPNSQSGHNSQLEKH